MSEPGHGDLAEARVGTYRLLARLTLSDLDGELAHRLLDMPIFGEALAASGGEAALQRLRVDYARTFLMNVHPYESVHLDDQGMLNTPQTGAVLNHYQQHDFEHAALQSSGAPDHLGLELEFMAHLIEREVDSRHASRKKQARALAAEQLHFLEAHLLKWGPIFGAVLAEEADSPLYQTLGSAITSFLLGEHELLNQALAADEPDV